MEKENTILIEKKKGDKFTVVSHYIEVENFASIR